MDMGELWFIFLFVGLVIIYLLICGIIEIIHLIEGTIKDHKNNVHELETMIENILSQNIDNIRFYELGLATLKKKNFFRRPSRRKIRYCQSLLSPYIIEAIQCYSKKIIKLEDLVNRQEITSADNLLKEIQCEKNRVPIYCTQYDQTLKSLEKSIIKLKSIQRDFDEGIQHLQFILDEKIKNVANRTLEKLNILIEQNPSYRHFDKQLLAQLRNDLKIKHLIY